MAGVNIYVFVKVHSSKEAMTEQQRKNSWSLLACAAIIARPFCLERRTYSLAPLNGD